MKKIVTASLIFILLFISCNKFFGEFNSPKNSSSDYPPCDCNMEAFKKDVIDNWKYNEKAKCYITNDSFINRLNTIYFDCVYNADTSFIIKCFGRNFTLLKEEYRQRGYAPFVTPALEYSMCPPCNLSKGNGECPYLYFLVNQSYKVIRVKKELIGFTSQY